MSGVLSLMLFSVFLSQGFGHLSGVKSNLSPFVKATEYSSSSDEVGSSDDEEKTRWVHIGLWRS